MALVVHQCIQLKINERQRQKSATSKVDGNTQQIMNIFECDVEIRKVSLHEVGDIISTPWIKTKKNNEFNETLVHISTDSKENGVTFKNIK